MECLSVMIDELGEYLYLVVTSVVLFFTYVIGRIVYAKRIVRKEAVDSEVEQGVSVIITSRNCGEFLEKNLEYFLTQNYSNYEVIVVDECSGDRTAKILEDFRERYPHLKCTKIPFETKFRYTKKIAINIGVLAAKNDILLFSEITARPVSKDWIRVMQAHFDASTVAVVGYSRLSRSNKIIDFPYLYNFINYTRLVDQYNRGHYLLGNGYNMGYRKKDYLESRGFTYNSQIYLGYDCDIIQILSGSGTVKSVKDCRSYVEIERNADRSCSDLFMYRLANIKAWSLLKRLKLNWLSAIKVLMLLLLFYLFVNLISIELVVALLVALYTFDFLLLLFFLKSFGQTKLGFTSFMYSTVGFLYSLYLTYGCSLFIGKKWR